MALLLSAAAPLRRFLLTGARGAPAWASPAAALRFRTDGAGGGGLSAEQPDEQRAAPMGGGGAGGGGGAPAGTATGGSSSSQDDGRQYKFSNMERNWTSLLEAQLRAVTRESNPGFAEQLPPLMTAVRAEFRRLYFAFEPRLTPQQRDSKPLWMLLLSVATVKALPEVDTELVRAVVHVNLGGKGQHVLTGILKARLAVQRFIFKTDPLRMAADVADLVKRDLETAGLVECEVSKPGSGGRGDDEDDVTATVTRCHAYELLKEADALELLPEFCCSQNLSYLKVFEKYGLEVECDSWRGHEGDDTCVLRVSRPQAGAAGPTRSN